jgi:hypothetical protein
MTQRRHFHAIIQKILCAKMSLGDGIETPVRFQDMLQCVFERGIPLQPGLVPRILDVGLEGSEEFGDKQQTLLQFTHLGGSWERVVFRVLQFLGPVGDTVWSRLGDGAVSSLEGGLERRRIPRRPCGQVPVYLFQDVFRDVVDGGSLSLWWHTKDKENIITTTKLFSC